MYLYVVQIMVYGQGTGVAASGVNGRVWEVQLQVHLKQLLDKEELL
jgi:hypothetical protein